MALDAWTFDPTSTGTFPIGALTYRELNESGDATFSDEASEAHRTFLVDWDQSKAFMSDCLGGATFAAGRASKVSRIIPEAHCDYPDFYASSCKIKVKGGGSVSLLASTWTLAVIDVTFKPVDYRITADDETSEINRFVRRVTRAKGDYLQLAINSFKWVSRPADPKSLGATPGIIVAGELAEYTWLKVPSVTGGADVNRPYRCPVEAKILLQLGTCNDAAFDTVHPTGTALFTAAEAEMVRPNVNGGEFTWNIRYYFEIKNHGNWITDVTKTVGVNYLYDAAPPPVAGVPQPPRWDLVTTTGAVGGQTLYQSSDFTKLFTLA